MTEFYIAVFKYERHLNGNELFVLFILISMYSFFSLLSIYSLFTHWSLQLIKPVSNLNYRLCNEGAGISNHSVRGVHIVV